MEEISKTEKIKIPSNVAFQLFVDEMGQWWPKEYTWSQDKLMEMKIERNMGGHCTEIGPNGFRCDWGTVTAFVAHKKIGLKWQIGPKREPVPDLEKGSCITVEFLPDGSNMTLRFEHFNFENHGEGFEAYRKAMDSPQGWDYILDSFKSYCLKSIHGKGERK